MTRGKGNYNWQSQGYPSFYLHPERKVFYCFGCGVGGDVFDFVMRSEVCDLRRALDIVASGVGVAAVSEGRRPERPDGGVGAKPLKAAKRPNTHSQSVHSIASAQDTEERRASIQRLNLASSQRLATACEPLTADELSLLVRNE